MKTVKKLQQLANRPQKPVQTFKTGKNLQTRKNDKNRKKNMIKTTIHAENNPKFRPLQGNASKKWCIMLCIDSKTCYSVPGSLWPPQNGMENDYYPLFL